MSKQLLKPRLHDTTCCETGCQGGLPIERTAAVRSTRLSIRLSNCLDNRLDVCLHDTAGCQTGYTTGLTTGYIV